MDEECDGAVQYPASFLIGCFVIMIIFVFLWLTAVRDRFFENEKGTTDSLLPPPEDLRINCAFNVQILNLPTKAGLGFLPSPSCELVKQALSQPFKATSSDKSSGAMK